MGRDHPHRFTYNGADGYTDGYNPANKTATWWLDGVKQMSATAPYVPAIAAKQHFYLILSGQSHGKQKEHLTFVSGVRAYVPPASPLSAVK